jgi:phosphoribosylformylglycinamidine synthase
VGLLPDYRRRADFASLREGDTLLLVGESHGAMGASLYLRECLGREDGAPPPVDLAAERRNGDFVRQLIRSGVIDVVHDLSDGGLALAAAEMALASEQGVRLEIDPVHAAATLFGEDQARYLIAVADPSVVIEEASKWGVPISRVGKAAGDAFAADPLFSLPLATLRSAHEAWLPAYMTAA